MPDDPVDDDIVWTRWKEVDRIFALSLDLPEPERRAAIDSACDGDAELRDVVLDLLARSRSADARVSTPGPDLLRAALPNEPADRGEPGDGSDRPGGIAPGDLVGRYRVIGELGRGGMATVYEAERSDGVYRQVVALKVLRRGLDTDQIVERFLAERQILSDFAHPNVARLLDGGATPDGRPFLVMEKVDGEPLTAWADAREAGIRARLELFLQVTDAVKEAHRRLVVHRDLKPGNILVTGSGDVKLLDFGIAKLIDPAGGETDLTLPGAHPLTLRYASPEQLRGEMVTASSDIYQLGLILYELLTGLHPFAGCAVPRSAVDPGSPSRVVRAIANVPPERLDQLARSRASTPRALERRLRGDLDTIVARALEWDPEDRYRSVEDLAEDVRRHLEGQPIRARPAPWTLRSRKWLARNRWAPPVAAVLVLVAAGWVVMLTLNAQRLERERNEARAHAERAEQVTAYLTGVFEAVDPDELGGVDVTVIELLDESAARAAIELEGQPGAQAEVLSTIGAMYVARGQYDRATPLLERSAELGRGAGGDPADLVRDLRRLADALYDDRDRAISVLEEAVTVAERELGPGDARLGAALTDLAYRLSSVRTPEARERSGAALDRALAILRNQPDTDVRAELAEALNLSALGGDLSDLPRLEEALELRRSLYGEDHTAVAGTLNDMALLLEPFDPGAADTLLEQAAAINERIHGPDHRLTLTILNNLAGRYRDRGDFAKAEPLYRTVLQRRRAAYPADSVSHAYAMHGLGWSLTETGRAAEAEPLLREVVRLIDPGPGRTSAVHEMARSTLGRCLAVEGRYREAEPLLRDSYEAAVAATPNAPFIPFMLDRLIDLYDAWGKPAAAREYRARQREPESAGVTEDGAAGESSDADPTPTSHARRQRSPGP